MQNSLFILFYPEELLPPPPPPRPPFRFPPPPFMLPAAEEERPADERDSVNEKPDRRNNTRNLFKWYVKRGNIMFTDKECTSVNCSLYMTTRDVEGAAFSPTFGATPDFGVPKLS